MDTNLLQENQAEIKELEGFIRNLDTAIQFISKRPGLLVKALEAARDELARDLFYAKNGMGD